MRIYLDNCALGRLSDDQNQPRLIEEARAVETILLYVQRGALQWCASAALRTEVLRNNNTTRRLVTLSFLDLATEIFEVTPAVLAQASHLQSFGLSRFDTLHLACAVAVEADFLLTTDDRFLHRCNRLSRENAAPAFKQVEVYNPVQWLAEVYHDEY